jgi:putative MATE family efflux protein
MSIPPPSAAPGTFQAIDETAEAAAMASAREKALAALLHGPLLTTLLRLALPTVVVLSMTTLLGVAETYFVSGLGASAIAAASLVVPVMMLMTMVSNGGIGGGVSSAIARARGAGRHDDAESLAWHAVVIGTVAGALFMLAAIIAGPLLYKALGGAGAALHQAVLYSDILFSGAIVFWVLMLLQASLRGAGNVKIPALVMMGSVCVGLLLSPSLITGSFGFPRLGIAGAGVAQVLCNIVALVLVVRYMRSAGSNLKLRRHPLRAGHFKAILGVGLFSSINAVMSNLAITALTAAAGAFGVAGIAGYGIASRLELLLIPVMFGFGTAVIIMVGTNLGAGNVSRARRAALLNAFFVAALLEVIGLAAGIWPHGWLGLFSTEPAVLDFGTRYLRVVAPCYAFIAVVTELYFAGQGAGKILWPMAAGAVRLAFALAASACVLLWHAGLATAFEMIATGIAVSAAVSLYGFYRVQWAQVRKHAIAR